MTCCSQLKVWLGFLGTLKEAKSAKEGSTVSAIYFFLGPYIYIYITLIPWHNDNKSFFISTWLLSQKNKTQSLCTRKQNIQMGLLSLVQGKYIFPRQKSVDADKSEAKKLLAIDFHCGKCQTHLMGTGEVKAAKISTIFGQAFYFYIHIEFLPCFSQIRKGHRIARSTKFL